MLAAVTPHSRGSVAGTHQASSDMEAPPAHVPSYNSDALSAIRRALGAEEQVIRVSDSKTRETYDVMLSRTAPYASPYVSKTDSVQQPTAVTPRRRRAPRWIRSASVPYDNDTPESVPTRPHTANPLDAQASSEPPTPDSRTPQEWKSGEDMRRTHSARTGGDDARPPWDRAPWNNRTRAPDAEVPPPVPPLPTWVTSSPSPSQLAPESPRSETPNAAAPPLSLYIPSLGKAQNSNAAAAVPAAEPDVAPVPPTSVAQTGSLGISVDPASAPPAAAHSAPRVRLPADAPASRPAAHAGVWRPSSGAQPRLNGATSWSSISTAGATEAAPTFDEEMAQNADLLRRTRRAKEQDAQRRVSTSRTTGAPASPRSPRSPRFSMTHHHHHHAHADEAHDQPRAFMGNLIGEEHVNYVLMYHMLTGIRIGVSRCESRPRMPLTSADFSAKYKFTFDIVGNELSPSSNYDFKFKDYAPAVFRELRYHFHLDTADYLLSLTAKYILSELGSPGKSGSFFYFSRDYRFIIKTIRHNEQKFLMKILPAYYRHVRANPHTLLSQFYGLHRVKLQGGRKVHFVIMNNLFPPHRDIHEMYDLKGSLVKREQMSTKAHAVLKDMNWVKRGRYLELGPQKRELLAMQLRSDVALLQRLNIMDYSMLIGLHDLRIGNHDELQQSLQVFQPAPENEEESGVSPITPEPALRRPSIVVNSPEPGVYSATDTTVQSPTSAKEKPNADALRSALCHADPTTLSEQTTTKLPNRMSERRYYYFYADEGGFRSTNEANEPTNIIYYLGVIDLFTQYNLVKRSEHIWKSVFYNARLISPVAPKAYGERFIRFLLARPDKETGERRIP